ncbi:haloacid dehalogenase-like hydrolase [Candidatus Woesearchaeota archaeon]|nr:haloacid dehalogenase-like hydrolase [Candidatus Woesearchaeota archaeon]
MKFLIEPKDGVWLAVREDLDETTLAEQILSCGICVSDLDDCDAKSPAKKLAYGDLKTTRAFDPRFIWWSLTQGAPAKFSKSGESKAWKGYIERFLKDEAEIQKAVAKFDPETIRQSLYPGVEDFYQLLSHHNPHHYKVYLTRNIVPIAAAYGKFLGFNEVLGKCFDKEKSLERLMMRHSFPGYFIKGDSEEDEAMLGVLESCKKRKVIDQYITLYRSDKPTPKKMNPKFDINIGKNYSGLVEVMKKMDWPGFS